MSTRHQGGAQWRREHRRSSEYGKRLNEPLSSQTIVEKPKRNHASDQYDEPADEQNYRQRLPPDVENDRHAYRSDDVVNGVFVHLYISEGRVRLGDFAAR